MHEISGRSEIAEIIDVNRVNKQEQTLLNSLVNDLASLRDNEVNHLRQITSEMCALSDRMSASLKHRDRQLRSIEHFRGLIVRIEELEKRVQSFRATCDDPLYPLSSVCQDYHSLTIIEPKDKRARDSRFAKTSGSLDNILAITKSSLIEKVSAFLPKEAPSGESNLQKYLDSIYEAVSHFLLLDDPQSANEALIAAVQHQIQRFLQALVAPHRKDVNLVNLNRKCG